MPRSGKRARSDSASSTSSTASTSGSGSGSEGSTSPGPYNKILRSSPSLQTPGREVLECNLPPTCFPESRTFGSSTELDRHQLAFHTYICRTPIREQLGNSSTSTHLQAGAPGAVGGVWDLPSEFTSRKGGDRWKECRKVFPDQRLLDLVSDLPPGPSLVRETKDQ